MTKKKINIRDIAPILVLLVLLVAIIVAIILVTGGRNPEPKRKNFYGMTVNGEFVEYFNTACSIYDYSGMSEDEFDRLCTEVEDQIRYYHKLFDVRNEYPGIINLCTLNRAAGGDPIAVTPQLYNFLEFCIRMHTLTGGEVNIAMGSVISIWKEYMEDGINSPASAKLPPLELLISAAEHTDISSILLDPEQRTVQITDPLTSIDVGAIGKGYAAERIADMLRGKGVSGFVVDLGRNLSVIGEKPSGDGWSTGIVNPDTSSGNSYIKKLEIRNTSLVTSGDYVRYYTVDGVRYHHIIDKDSLMPAEYFASVTVMTADSGVADALSTALFCMSYEEGRALVSSIADGGTQISVYWVTKDGRVLE